MDAVAGLGRAGGHHLVKPIAESGGFTADRAPYGDAEPVGGNGEDHVAGAQGCGGDVAVC